MNAMLQARTPDTTPWLTPTDIARVRAQFGLLARDADGFAIDDDAYQLSGATRPADLLLQMQVLAAYLTDPGLRAAPFQQIKAFIPQILTQQLATPGGAFAIQAAGLLAGGDQREAVPSPEQIAAFTLDELKQGVTQGMAAGPIDIVMVGDVTVDDAIATVASLTQ